MSAVIKNQAIPATWELVPLKELGQWSGGGTPSKSEPKYWTSGRIPWVSPKDMKTDRITDSEDHITKAAIQESATKLLPAGSVLIVTRSGILRHTLPVAVTTVPVTLNQDLKALTPKEGILPEYVAWALRGFAQDILNTCSKQGTTVNSIETTALHRFVIPVAPFDQQKLIVAEIEKQFSRLNEAVVNLKRVKANLKRYKAAVLKAAAEGRLVETEAELARREGRSYETGAQLLQRILETRRSEWKGRGKYKEPAVPVITDQTGLPEGWVWTTTEQLGHVQLGRQRSPKNRSRDYPVKYIRAANITEKGLVLDDVMDMEFTPDEQERYRLHRGDLLLSEASGSPDQVGKPAIWQGQLPLCCFQNTVIRLRSAIELSPYLLICFQAYYVNGLFSKVAGGVGINHLSADKFSRIRVSLPPLAEQYRIVDEVERRLSFVREVEAQVDTNLSRSQRFRQSVLYSAFSPADRGRVDSHTANIVGGSHG